MSMDSTLPSTDTIWQTGLKRKIQQSVVYRRHISLTETNTVLGERLEDLPSEWPPKTGRSNNIYLKVRPQTYIDQMR
jgi:hypothetical protein